MVLLSQEVELKISKLPYSGLWMQDWYIKPKE